MFLDMGDDWDLQAVVRGCCTATAPVARTSTSVEEPSYSSCFLPPPLGLNQDDHHALCFPDLLETQTALQELEALCKPFFSKVEPLSPQSNPTSLLTDGGFKDQHRQKQKQHQQKSQQQQKHSPQCLTGPTTAAAATTSTSHSQTPRSKRRKNQQKRVCQVPAESLSSDMWAWRKYGQKPIKGSPYPRGYYRCSSSKGCLARKQVERSRSDPGIIIITYTAEHNHPVPTHRNSLAGSTRQKFSTPQESTPTEEPRTPTNKPSCSSPASKTGLSPSTPLSTATMEDELLQQSKQESRDDEEEEMVEDNDEDDDLLIPDMVMEDDFFVGLGELDLPTTGAALDDCFADQQPPATFSPPWLAHHATTAAGGS